MHIVHLAISLAIGGAERVVVNLASNASRGYRTHIICLESLGPLASLLNGTGVTVECLGTPRTTVPQSVRALRKRLAALAPDVLHTHNEKAHIHGALATIGMRRPVIVHTRHGRGQVDTRAARWANRLAVHRSRFIVSVSADSSAVAVSEGARPEQQRVIINAIDVNTFDASGVPQRLGHRRALAVARLAPVKDVGTMLRAARLVANDLPDFHVDIVGDGESRASLEQLASELGLQQTVTFHGASPTPAMYFSTASVFVQSSISEGISLTLLEAMAAGLPVVATDVGGNKEIVDVGRTGWLVPAQDPRALADALIRVFSHPEEALAMSRAARQKAETQFDLTRMVREYEALYVAAAR